MKCEVEMVEEVYVAGFEGHTIFTGWAEEIGSFEVSKFTR
jgi:hypothetical protein